MKYQEGNYILTEYGEVPIKHVVFNRYMVAGENGRNLWVREIKPILLTKDWLLKFGFRTDITNDYYLYIPTLETGDIWQMYLITCDNLDDDGRVTILTMQLRTDSPSEKVTEWPWIHLDNTKYAHQLQNLYFALTGQELKIKNLK